MQIVDLGNAVDGADNSVEFEWPATVNLRGKTILAFGGAGNLSETFIKAAATCGARIALVDWPPSEEARREEFDERVREIARAVAAISQSSQATASDRTPIALYANITDLDDVLAAVSEVKSRFGTIDIAINFAGRQHPTFDLVNDPPERLVDTFRDVIDLNLNGAFIFTLALARVMVPRRHGHIIHLCSNASRLSLYASYGYNASKHGVEGLVKTAAAQLAPFGVRVNGLAPGTVVTDLNRALTCGPDGELQPRAKSILAHTPTKRFLTREGVAETLLTMCVEQRHLTGNLIFPDDGYNIEGHSWPEGNEAVYAGQALLDRLYRELADRFPPEE